MADDLEVQLREYFREAALLRWCLFYNHKDYEFTRDSDAHIVYIFDANIVRFFIDPSSEWSKVVAFRKNFATSHARATATITAEYLFSRGLPGQHNRPPLISPAHGDDLNRFVDQLAKKPRLTDDQLSDRDKIERETKATLDSFAERIRKKQFHDIDEVTSELRQKVPSVAELLEGWRPSRQLLRIYNEDLLRSLNLHVAATYEVLEPDAKEVDEWASLIANERYMRDKGKVGGEWTGIIPKRQIVTSNRTATRDKRDAIALVQTMKLDAAAETNDPPTCYVLVTDDHALFDAYVRWFWNPKNLYIRGRFVLRLLLQYIPIINTLDMPNQIHNSHLTKKAFAALDSLFGNLRQIEPGFAEKLAYYRLRDHEDIGNSNTPFFEILTKIFGKNPLTLARDDIKRFMDTRNDWDESFRNGVVLNSNLLHRRHDLIFRELAGVLRDELSWRDAIERDQSRSLERVVAATADFTTRLNASDLPLHHVPFLVRTDQIGLSPAIGRWLSQNLDPAAIREDEQLRTDLYAIGHSNQAYRLAIAAVVAFRGAHWLGAQTFAQEGLERFDSLSLETEFEYLFVASTRHRLAALEDDASTLGVERARDLLKRTVERVTSLADKAGERRAGLEKLALDLMILRRELAGEIRDLNVARLRARNICLDALDEAELINAALDAGEVKKNLVIQAYRVAIAAATLDEFVIPSPTAISSLIDRTRINLALVHLAEVDEQGIFMPIDKAYLTAMETATGLLSPSSAVERLAQWKGKEDDPWMSSLDLVEINALLTALPVRMGRDI